MKDFKPYYVKDSEEKKHIFQVRKNMTEPCPECGVPACGKEDVLWYEKNEKRIAIVFDGSILDLGIDEFLKENMTKENYSSLPRFLQDYNEYKGWAKNWDYDGFVVDIESLLETIELLKTKENQWLEDELLSEIGKIAKEAQVQDLDLRIVRG